MLQMNKMHTNKTTATTLRDEKMSTLCEHQVGSQLKREMHRNRIQNES